jgi:hypothetical protein
MGKGRQGRLLSYLALAMVIVGALVHGLPASAAQQLPAWQLDAIVDAASAGDHGILPGPLQPRDLRDQRSARASLDNGADSDTLVATDACAIGPVGNLSFFLFDSERCSVPTPRLAHRPRDPPRLS